MMMCFKGFRSKSQKKTVAGGGQGKTAPELRKKSNADSRPNRAAKSTGSLPTGRSFSEIYKEREQNLRVFSLAELAEATNRFSRLLKIGEGGFGSVYKGSIDSENGQGPPTIVAIKKLNTRGFQGHKQWVTEVQFLGVLRHPNLVKLLGYCATDGERGIQRLLVYEYMPNKSLEDHLFNHSVPVIPWTTRLNIILGAAEGMAYLHEDLEKQVIYRDFKSSNILLDKDFNAKLSDFGLAREGPTGDRTHVSTAPVGTQGYAAPEYIETGQLSIKSDVYSFGVVLYEILTGRRTLERDLPSAEQKLLEWVKQFPAESSRFCMIMDPHLRNTYNLKTARRIAQLADRCLSKNPRDRPAMSQVVEILKQAVEESMTSTDRHPPSSSKHTRMAAGSFVPGHTSQPTQA